MRWHSPNLLWLLWLLPLVGWLLFRAQQKRVAAARAFATGSMRMRLVPQFSSTRTWLKTLLLLAAIAAAIVAVARPKYGAYYEQVSQNGVDLFVLLDVSRSMLAADIAPNRLERAKSDIVDLLARIPTDRIGLIVFAGKAVSRIPLTNDHTFYRQMLRDVDVDSAPIGGSLIGDAIRAGLGAMPHRSDRDQVMVLITDGEDHDSFPLDAARLAADRGVKIITVGLGDTNDGARIPEPSERTGFGFMKDKQGKEVWSRMDEELLKKIALETSGAYIPARTMSYDLGQIYDEHLSGLTRSEMRTEKRKRFREQFQWFTALAFALLVSESLLGRGKVVAAVVAGCLLLSGNIVEAADGVAIDVAEAPSVPESTDLPEASDKPSEAVDANETEESGDPVAQTREGLKAFEDGDFARAAKLFSQAAKASPDDPRIVFNQACAVAASETPHEARDLFFESALARDVALSADSHYNLGCMASTKAKSILGDDSLKANKEQRTESIELLNQAMVHFRDALASDPDHQNSRHNLETLRLWVKQMQALWEQKDREQSQASKNALDMLKEMDKRQLAQRTLLSEEHRKPDSPSRLEQINGVREQQLLLADDVEPLRQKLLEENVANVSDPDVAAGIEEGVNETAQLLRTSMESAASDIDSGEFEDALSTQRKTLETMDLTYGAIAPYPEVLQRSIQEQESRVGASEESIKSAQDKTNSIDNGQDAGAQNGSDTKPNLDDLGWRQQRVQQYASFLLARAQEQLPVLEQMVEQAVAAQEEQDPEDEDDDPTAQQPPLGQSQQGPGQQLSPDQIDEQVQPLIDSMSKAVELAPQVVELTKESVELLENGEFETALPKQQEALKLLKEIAEGMPQNENKNQDQENQNQNGEQDQDPEQNQDGEQSQDGKQGAKNQDEQQPDRSDDQQQDGKEKQNGKDEQNGNEKQNDNDDQSGDQQNADQNGEKPEDKDDKSKGQQPEPKPEQNNPDESGKQSTANPKPGEAKNGMTPARLESILQRVRERERQHRQIRKQLRNLLQQRQRPEKDW